MKHARIKPIDLAKIKTYPIAKRLSKVKVRDFAGLCKKGVTFDKFYRSLPKLLKANEIRAVCDAICKAYKRGKPIIFMVGAHVLKCGLSPIIIDLMKRRVITLVAMNGAGMIHDFEIALIGQTSEDVARSVEDGSFGMARETASFINEAVSTGVGQERGIGWAVGERIWKENLPNKRLSILATGYHLNIPVTVHVAIGTDIIHQHPSCDGAAVGKGSFTDFQIFASIVSKLGNGGVTCNIGSAVILPEVFLKAITIARNLGYKVKNMTCASFDMIHQYRPEVNVVRRPISLGGKGYSITGHHEIMLPLLRQAIIERL